MVRRREPGGPLRPATHNEKDGRRAPEIVRNSTVTGVYKRRVSGRDRYLRVVGDGNARAGETAAPERSAGQGATSKVLLNSLFRSLISLT